MLQEYELFATPQRVAQTSMVTIEKELPKSCSLVELQIHHPDLFLLINPFCFAPAIDFMKTTGINDMVLMGGSLLKNDLRQECQVDDYDVAITTEQGGSIERLRQIIQNIPEAWQCSNEKSDYSGVNRYYTIHDDKGREYGFGYKPVIKSTLNVDSFHCSISLDDSKEPKIILHNVDCLRDLQQGIVRFTDGVAVEFLGKISRIQMVAAKYPDYITFKTMKPLIDGLHREGRELMELGKLDVNEIDDYYYLNKLCNIMSRMKKDRRENFIEGLLESELLKIQYPVLQETFRKIEFRKDLAAKDYSEEEIRKLVYKHTTDKMKLPIKLLEQCGYTAAGFDRTRARNGTCIFHYL